MKIFIVLISLLILFGLLVCYSACVVASRADKDEHEMYQEWKKKHTEIPSEITTCVGVAVALLDDEHEMYEAWKERQKNEVD